MKYKTDDIVEFTINDKIQLGRIFAKSFLKGCCTYHIAGPHAHMKFTPGKIRGLVKEQYIKINTVEDLYI